MRLPHPHIPFFRIFYSTTFTVLVLILTALLLMTPGDHILQSLQSSQRDHIIIVSSVYFLTFVIAIFVYAGRLFAIRSALANIPKKWNPAGTGSEQGVGLGMGHSVGTMVREGLERSAIISFEGRPRDVNGEAEKHVPNTKKKRRRIGRLREEAPIAGDGEPVWGIISHPGWSSPSSADLPNLHFDPVILELSHLIEAKAVSLAPVDPLWSAQSEGNLEGEDPEPPMPDILVVELLQRPATTGLRDYLAHLTALGMLPQSDTTTIFASLYEYARFSDTTLPETQFRELMSLFATILGELQPVPTDIVNDLHTAAEMVRGSERSDSNADVQSLATIGTVQHTPLPNPETDAEPDADNASQLSPTSSSLSGRSVRTVHTAPSRPSRQHAARSTSYTSQQSASSVRRTYEAISSPLSKARSHNSSAHSLGSDVGSVIRLAERAEELALPFTIVPARE